MLRGAPLAVAVSVCATCQGLVAKDLDAPIHLFTPGNDPSCGAYTVERATRRDQQLQFWLRQRE